MYQILSEAGFLVLLDIDLFMIRMLRNCFYFIITSLLWSSKLRVIQETNQSIATGTFYLNKVLLSIRSVIIRIVKVLCYHYNISVIIRIEQLRRPSGKSVRLGNCRLGFDSELGQTNDLKVGIHSFPA